MNFPLNQSIPCSETGRGYVRVTKNSLRGNNRKNLQCLDVGGILNMHKIGLRMVGEQQHMESPTITMARLACRIETRGVNTEILHQDCMNACGYRLPIWRIQRALQSINNARVLIRECAVTAAPFLESAARPINSFWGEHRGPKWFCGRA